MGAHERVEVYPSVGCGGLERTKSAATGNHSISLQQNIIFLDVHLGSGDNKSWTMDGALVDFRACPGEFVKSQTRLSRFSLLSLLITKIWNSTLRVTDVTKLSPCVRSRLQFIKFSRRWIPKNQYFQISPRPRRS
jgi:hypothetical protein